MMTRRCRLKDCAAHQAPTHNAKHFVCVSLIDCFRDFFFFVQATMNRVCLSHFFFFILLVPLQLLAVQTSSGSVAEQKKTTTIIIKAN